MDVVKKHLNKIRPRAISQNEACPAPREGTPGPCPQMTACAPQTKNFPPPKRGLCPEKINKLGANGVQIEALNSQNRAYRPRIRHQELFFGNFCGLTTDFMKLRVYLGTKTFLFFFFVFTFFVCFTLSNSHK